MKRIVTLLLLGIMMFSLVSCGSGGGSAPAAKPATPAPAPAASGSAPAAAPAATTPDWSKVRIGVAHISLYDEWCKGVADEFRRQCAALGFPEPVVQAPDQGSGPEAQMKIVENFVAMGFNVILVDPSSPDAIVPSLELAGQQGIPVIAFDSTSTWEGQISHIAWDHAETGVLTGNYVVDYAKKNLGGKVKVGMIESLGAPHTQIRGVKFRETIEAGLGKENVTYVYEQAFESTRESSEAIVTNNLAKPVDIIWTAVDNAAQGARIALKNNNAPSTTKVVCAGIWGAEPFSIMYEGDPWYMVGIGVDPSEIVKLTLQTAMDVLSGKTDIPKRQNIELSVIDASNVSQYMKFVPEEIKAGLKRGPNVKE